MDKEEEEDLIHRADGVFELSPLLEGNDNDDAQERHASHQLGHPDNYEVHNVRPIAPADPPSQAFTKIEYLDGIRGLAAFWVFMQHSMGAYTGTEHIFGWGEDGTHHHFINFHLVRLFFGSGGDAAVVIFFVLSGYVLSISSFRKLKQNKPSECRRALLSALIRRPIRLYAPPFAVTFIHSMLLHVPGPLVLPLPWYGGKPRESIVEELKVMVDSFVGYFSIFHTHASNLFAFPYNAAVWTIPLELKGSLLVFAIIFVLSLGMHGSDPKVPLMAAIMIFATAGIMVQHNWKWSMAAFMFGMVLALVDTWPIGAQIRGCLSPVAEVTASCSQVMPKWNVVAVGGRLVELAQGTLEALWIAISSVKLMPRWLAKRLPRRRRPNPAQGRPKKASTFAHVCFWVGFYLLSQPSSAGSTHISYNTPGWVWLSTWIPEEYDDNHYYRYWQCWASVMVIYGILRISYLQRFFTTRALEFLGYVSFMLYLTHLNFFRIWPDRINALFGGNVEPTLKDSFWDNTWAISNDQLLWGIGLRFWVAESISLPSSLLVAWVFTKLVDEPSVKLGKLITKRIGLDKPKSNPPPP